MPVKQKAVEQAGPIVVKLPEWGTLVIPIVGITPLCVHKKGDEVAEQILAQQQRKADKGKKILEAREPKNAFKEFVAGFHFMDKAKLPKQEIGVGDSWPFVKGAFGFPARSFKSAMVNATTVIPSVSKDLIRKCIWVKGDLAPLTYSRVELHRAVLPVGWPQKPDVRHRPLFHDWKTEVTVDYLKAVFDRTTVVNLLATAGRICGLGEDRPGKSGGSWGIWEIGENIKEIA